MNNKVLKWNFIFQYGWVITNIFNSLLLLPLYLKNIDANTLGVWLATGNVLGWMTLVDPGIGEVLQQKIAEIRGRGETGETGKLIGSGILASGIIFLLALLVGIVCYFLIGKIINKDIGHYPHLPMAIFISVLATGITLISFSVSGINQGLHNSAHVAISSLSANFLFLGVNLVLLFSGWGVMSIAMANLSRAMYISLFNCFSMFRALKKERCMVLFNRDHFKKFIRIFSFTSASKIIGGLSYSIDMIVLARYLSPAVITMYEINKRPVNIAYSLVGRHSVALMPVISHANGMGDKESILRLVDRQFRLYCYAALLAAFLFIFNYHSLIDLWTGKGHFAGQLTVNLLVASFIINLLCYFVAIIGYALGDIKMNSVYNIIRNIFFGAFMFLAAKYYGIVGTIAVAIGVSLFADLGFYCWRLKKLGYFVPALWTGIFGRWLVIIPCSCLFQWVLSIIINRHNPSALPVVKLLLHGFAFSFFFVLLVLTLDAVTRRMLQQIISPVINKSSVKRRTADLQK